MIVGVNRFVEHDTEDVELLRMTPTPSGASSSGLRASGRNGTPSEAEAALAEVRRVAAGPENLLPPMREALRARVTIGEISNALRDEFGTFDASRA